MDRPAADGRTDQANPVTLEQLRQGIARVLKYQAKKGKVPWDFHNSLYARHEEYRRRGLDHEFWDVLVDDLWSWHAIRGRTKHTKAGIREEGLQRFSMLKECFTRLIGNSGVELPSIDSVRWDDAKPLFDVARKIKDATSPMFASKLCHFLVPSIYFITDGTLVKRGWKDYPTYWKDCRSAWLCRHDDQALQDELKKEIAVAPCDSFPWATKITELCQFDIRSAAGIELDS